MVRFHNAADSEGRIIEIKDVTKENNTKQYFCIGCGTEMSAVLGDKREHHFRHKGDACSWESYLHKLGKKILKERFYKQKVFEIGYFVENVCEKSNDCKLGYIYSNKCNGKYLCHVDLKKLYDTCEEEVSYKGFRADLMLSHSEHPEREPIFLEISVTHDCEQEKIESGIRIIELKVNNEYDVLCPLEEKDSLFIDTLSVNPYLYKTSHPIRFYNFERIFKTKRPLLRFFVSRGNGGIFHANVIQDGLSCQDVKTNHRKDSVFEVAIPAEILINGQKCNIGEFGMMRASKNNVDVKHCYFCERHKSCICTSNVEEVDKKSEEKRTVTRYFKMASLTDADINKFARVSNLLCLLLNKFSNINSSVSVCYD